MRWLLFAVLLSFMSNAQSQWVKFKACGHVLPDDRSSIAQTPTQQAPLLGPVFVWAPSITMIIGYTEQRKEKGHGPACTVLITQSKNILVIGSIRDIRRAIKRAGGH